MDRDRSFSVHGGGESEAGIPAPAPTLPPTMRRLAKIDAALEGAREGLAKVEFALAVAGAAAFLFRVGYETGQRERE